MAKIEVEGDKAKVQLYPGVSGPTSEIEITRDEAIKRWKDMAENPDDYRGHHFDVNDMMDTLADVTEKITQNNIDKMNEENNG
jgi:hypothetical protein